MRLLRLGFQAVALAALFVAPAQAQWTLETQTDPMTDQASTTVTSAGVRSVEPMPAPYDDLQAWLVFGCVDALTEWVSVGFSVAPNLTNARPAGGFDIVPARTRWDDELQEDLLRHDFGSRYLVFRRSQRARGLMETSGSILLELHWYGAGLAYFRFPLDGAADAISEARSKCRSVLSFEAFDDVRLEASIGAVVR